MCGHIIRSTPTKEHTMHSSRMKFVLRLERGLIANMEVAV